MLTRFLDRVFTVFLITNIFIAVLLDFQPLYPKSTPLIKQIEDAFCSHYQSTLLCYETPIWLYTLLYIELIFLFPMYIVGAYGMFFRRNWVRDPMMIMGFHILTTASVYMVETYYNDSSPSKMSLIYGTIPFVVIPGLMVLRFICVKEPFETKIKFQ